MAMVNLRLPGPSIMICLQGMIMITLQILDKILLVWGYILVILLKRSPFRVLLSLVISPLLQISQEP